MRQDREFTTRVNDWRDGRWVALSINILAITGILFWLSTTAYAKDIRPATPSDLGRASFQDLFQQHYSQYVKKDSDPEADPRSAALYTCQVCHNNSDINQGPITRNPFGEAVKNNFHPQEEQTSQQEIDALNSALVAIEQEDSDNDSFTNFEEIVAGTFPGVDSSTPTAKIKIILSINKAAVIEGEPVTFTFTLTNVGNVSLSNIRLTVANLCTATLPSLTKGGNISTTCTFSAIGPLDNETATALFDTAKKKNLMDTSMNAVSLAVEPATPRVDLAVSATSQPAQAGQNMLFSIVVSNTGNVPLTHVGVTSPRTPACNRTLPDIAVSQSLLPYTCDALLPEELIEVRNGNYLITTRFFVNADNALNLTSLEPPSQTLHIDVTKRVLLPMISSEPQAEIDLIVTSIIVNNQGVKVGIKNQGTSPLSGIGYWVDLYINPTVQPTHTNQLSGDWGNNGLVWGVTDGVQTLQPDGEFVLQLNDQYFAPTLSKYPSQLSEGTKIYVQVDSANTLTNYGAVFETHERNGGTYNNIYSIVLASTFSTAGWTPATSSSAALFALEEQAPRH